MRVVVVADFSYPNFLGGSARYVYDLVKGFEQNNIDYLLITRKHKGEYSLEEDDSFYNQVSSQGKVFEIEGVASYIKSFFLLKKSDLILSHHPALGFLFALIFSSKRITYFFHGPYHQEFKARSKSILGFKIRKFLQSFVLKRSKQIFVLSKFMQNEVLKIFSSANIKIIPAIVDVAKFKVCESKKSLRNKFKIPHDKKVLFTSRRLTSRTGVLELTDSFINEFSIADYHLIIVGKGELADKLKRKVDNVGNISFYSFVSDDDLRVLMCLSDVYVLPTRKLEGFGLVVLESLCLKLPVVVSDHSGGAVEFISKYSRELIFELDNANSLKKSISFALSGDDILVSLFDAVKDYNLNSVSNCIHESL